MNALAQHAAFDAETLFDVNGYTAQLCLPES